MARVKVELPQTFPFSTDIKIRVTDLNYGGHMGNDALLSMIHEARMQFLQHYGYSELNLGGASVIMADVAIEYKGEGFYGDVLTVQMAAYDLHKYGFDLGYYITNQNGKEIAKAKTGMLCFNYQERKLMGLPQEVRAKFETKAA